ncbi:VOC family protein [Kribbella sp. NPDC051770]|uniref:VOC family protein n=1 Tax=Kribbella sp. NPDC051770 TaxID=3155413 RepID=UPI00341EA776
MSENVLQLRLVVTAPDYAETVAFYRDVLGLPTEEAYSSEDGSVTILDAGRATLEITDPNHAEYIDRVEVGKRVAGQFRLALQVTDAAGTTRTLTEAGASLIAEPTLTPWNSLNARLETPGGIQLTLFEELGD